MSGHVAMTLDHERRLAHLEALERAPTVYRGQLYQDDVGTVIAIGAVGADYVVTGMSATGLFGCTASSSALTVSSDGAGVYAAYWQLSVVTALNNQEIEAAIFIGLTRQAHTSAHHKHLVAADTVSFSGGGLLVLAAGDQVTLRIRNETAASDVTIEHAQLMVWRVGL